MDAITPPVEWQPMPRDSRELISVEDSSTMTSRFIEPVRAMLDNNEIEVEFRVKNNRGPDSRNQWWWRAKGQLTLFD